MRRYFLFFNFILFLFFHQNVFAAAFQFYELGTSIIGTAGVGQAAVASDASTSYFNPAGMAMLPASEIMLGTQIILPYINFSANKANTIAGNNGGNAGSLTPGLSAFYVYRYSPAWQFGISLTAPYGGWLNYEDHWVGRYNVQQLQLVVLDLNPVLSYQVNQWLTLGAGVTVEYANLYQTIAVPLTPVVDGQATLKLDNFSPGFNLGLLWTPKPETRIGLAYRSQIIHNLRGSIDFFNLSATPAATSKMVMPANLIASLSQQITNQFTLLGELGWANWSSMRNTVVTVLGFSASTLDNWHDTYRIGLGGQYQFIPSLLGQAGISFDSSPTSASHRLPSLPMDRQIRVGAGIEYLLRQAVTLGISYEYLNFGNASINNTSRVGRLSGSYSRNYANVIQASLNVEC